MASVQSNPKAPAAAGSAGPLIGYGGLISMTGFVASIFLLVWGIGWLVQLVELAGIGRVLLVVAGFAMIAALVAFELAHKRDWSDPLRRSWAYWDTLRRTAIESMFVPSAWIFVLSALAFVPFGSLFAPDALLNSVTTVSFMPFASGDGARAIAASAALGAGFVAAQNLSRYLLAGRGYLIATLRKNVPRDREELERATLATLRSYHALLRFSGAMAFLFELVFQVMAFGIVTWGVASAFPGAGLFTDPGLATLPNAITFWADRVFALVDGQAIFGVRLTPLEANRAVWPFGVCLLFFKLFAVAMIIRLFQDSLHLRPSDISRQWGEALERAAQRDTRAVSVTQAALSK